MIFILVVESVKKIHNVLSPNGCCRPMLKVEMETSGMMPSKLRQQVQMFEKILETDQSPFLGAYIKNESAPLHFISNSIRNPNMPSSRTDSRARGRSRTRNDHRHRRSRSTSQCSTSPDPVEMLRRENTDLKRLVMDIRSSVGNANQGKRRRARYFPSVHFPVQN